MIRHEFPQSKIVDVIKAASAEAKAANDTVVFPFNFWDITVSPTDSVAEIVGQFTLVVDEGEEDQPNIKLRDANPCPRSRPKERETEVWWNSRGGYGHRWKR